MLLNFLIKHDVILYRKKDGKIPFVFWVETLDKKIQFKINERISRIKTGNLGDYKYLDDGIYELRIHAGPGYRVYFAMDGKEVILLLCGEKSQQQQDIQKAKEYRKDYLIRRGKI